MFWHLAQAELPPRAPQADDNLFLHLPCPGGAWDFEHQADSLFVFTLYSHSNLLDLADCLPRRKKATSSGLQIKRRIAVCVRSCFSQALPGPAPLAVWKAGRCHRLTMAGNFPGRAVIDSESTSEHFVISDTCMCLQFTLTILSQLWKAGDRLASGPTEFRPRPQVSWLPTLDSTSLPLHVSWWGKSP